MANLLPNYPSNELTQAQQNLTAWQAMHAGAVKALAVKTGEAAHIYPVSYAQAYLREAQSRVTRFEAFVAQAKDQVALERARAYLAAVEAAQAASRPTGWLGRLVGNGVLLLVRILPGRSTPPVAG